MSLACASHVAHAATLAGPYACNFRPSNHIHVYVEVRSCIHMVLAVTGASFKSSLRIVLLQQQSNDFLQI